MRVRLLDQELKERLLAQDKKAWKEISALIHSCARQATWKIGASHLAEDVASEVLTLMYKQFIHQLSPGAALTVFLLEACRRVALSMQRSRFEDRLVFISDDDEEEETLPEPIQEDTTPLVHTKLIAQRARERIKASVSKDFWEQGQPKKKRNQYGCGDHDLARRLREERKRRGWTQKQMAAYMGLKLPTYISYEHACVITPNPHVIDTLRKMQAQPR